MPTFEARIKVADGPEQHVAVTSEGNFWVGGEKVAADHPTITALRSHPVTPEWVKTLDARPRGVSAQRAVPPELTWTAPTHSWQPPRDWGSMPLASCREARVEQVAHYDEALTPARVARHARALGR